jgi:hypothetical protein
MKKTNKPKNKKGYLLATNQQPANPQVGYLSPRPQATAPMVVHLLYFFKKEEKERKINKSKCDEVGMHAHELIHDTYFF